MVAAENFLTLGAASSVIEKMTGRRPSPVSIWRWARQGLKARNGERVKLGHVRVGGRLFIDGASLQPFFRALAEADQTYFDAKVAHAEQKCDSAPTAPRSRTDKAKADAVAKARRSLETATR